MNSIELKLVGQKSEAEVKDGEEGSSNISFV